MRNLNEIIVHCLDTKPTGWFSEQSNETKLAEVRRWHVEQRGWNDIGYHFVIMYDGTVMQGRPIELAGAHVQGRNAASIGIALEGGYGGTATDSFDEHFTGEQEMALRSLVESLKRRYGITKVSGHNDYAAKACPCFKVERFFAGKPAERKVWESSTIKAATVGTASVGAAMAESGDDPINTGLKVLPYIQPEHVLLFIVAGAILWMVKERLDRRKRGDL